MTFPTILPHLQAGRRVRRQDGSATYALKAGVLGVVVDEYWSPSTSADLLATDWELADEPPQDPRDATITRLTQELDTERRACGELGASNLRLIRELAETKTELAAAKARRCGEPLPGALQVIRCDLSVGHSGQHHMPGVGSGVSWST